MAKYEPTLDYRKRPEGDPENLYVDEDFPMEVAIKNTQGYTVEWKRPKDFMTNPALFTDGTTRFDINQGCVGSCWFLSTVSTIAKNETLIKQIIPDGSYRIDGDAYDGIFQARFYRFGKWEDVFVDDYLPVVFGNQLWGAHSKGDSDELWVALLEKAFAKLYGSYDAICGGQPNDAYLLLTGYLSEQTDLKNTKQDDFYNRIGKALSCGYFASCCVPSENNGKYGLIGGHAYSLVGVQKVDETTLLRVRNPWGQNEWSGPWSDGSEEWQTIPQDEISVPNKDDGEFFISSDDFFRYFDTFTITTPYPDFDKDGSPEHLDCVMRIYGKWEGKTAAGSNNILDHPKFSFTLTDQGMSADGTIAIYLQCIQQSKERNRDNISFRCDIFQVVRDDVRDDGKRYLDVRRQGQSQSLMYSSGLTACYRHKLVPGTYFIVPSTYDAGKEKSFLIRLFTPAPIKDVKRVPTHFSTRWVQ